MAFPGLTADLSTRAGAEGSNERNAALLVRAIFSRCSPMESRARPPRQHQPELALKCSIGSWFSIVDHKAAGRRTTREVKRQERKGKGCPAVHVHFARFSIS